MATRDPLLVPCHTDAYFVTFPQRKAERLEKMMTWVQDHPAAPPVPRVTSKTIARILTEEEANNRQSLIWMTKHIR